MYKRARRELLRNMPVMATALVVWAASVAVRLSVGFDVGRILSIFLISACMFIVGALTERVRRINYEEKMKERV
jgi:hypothetical protein